MQQIEYRVANEDVTLTVGCAMERLGAMLYISWSASYPVPRSGGTRKSIRSSTSCSWSDVARTRYESGPVGGSPLL